MESYVSAPSLEKDFDSVARVKLYFYLFMMLGGNSLILERRFSRELPYLI